MLIPSIDLMDGKIVQLVQGEKKKLEFDNFDYWIERFSKYPIVQLIDLDAARGAGNNRPLVKLIVCRLNCQVGGGIRNLETARQLLDLGAHKVIIGSALLNDGRINQEHARALAETLPKAALMFALASRGGRVDIDPTRPPSSVPCATTTSAPSLAASAASSGVLTMWITFMPAS
jgi:phosphoribosylformimino-5-aminoimidazole carboxamide ribotide isomerase